jgi:hypothetical protein
MSSFYTIQKNASVRVMNDENAEIISQPFTITDDIDEYINQVIQIPDATTDFVFPLTGIASASTIYIVTDREISIKINNTVPLPTTAITIKNVFMLSSSGITTLHISNSSGSVANVKLIIA